CRLKKRLDKHLIGAFDRNAGVARRFQGADHGDVVPFAVEAMGQGVQEGRLARLPGGMDEEVLLGPDQVQDILVAVPERLHHIVVLRVTQAGRVEEACHGAKIRGFRG
ncbi:MAG: hypothetical protein RL386_1257, partial [Bacteroidota bacterium]